MTKVMRKHKSTRHSNFEFVQPHLPIDVVPDAIVVSDVSGNIIQVNTQAESMFGYSKSELFTQPLEILMPLHYREAHARHRTGYFSRPLKRPMGTSLELYARR